MPRKSNTPTSVKQILVRDYNWRMGNLIRLRCNVRVLTDGRDLTAHRLVEAEIQRQERCHYDRLEAVAEGNMTYDLVVNNAYHELERAKRARV